MRAALKAIHTMATFARTTRTTAVPHLTVDERIARGKAARAEVPRSRHAEFEAPHDRADPVDLLEEQARTRVPELVPIRYGRMLVSPFTFYRGAAKIMAHDLAGTPALGADRAVLRRRPPVELRRVRVARAQAGIRHQRLRRDASGTVGVGRQASRREHDHRGARQRLRRQGPGQDRARHGQRVPRCDARVRRDAQPRGLVRPPGDRAGPAAVRGPVQARPGQADRGGAGQGAHARQHVSVLEAHAAGQRDGRDRRPVAADRAPPRAPSG